MENVLDFSFPRLNEAAPVRDRLIDAGETERLNIFHN
jgi:hypothetical protein